MQSTELSARMTLVTTDTNSNIIRLGYAICKEQNKGELSPCHSEFSCFDANWEYEGTFELQKKSLEARARHCFSASALRWAEFPRAQKSWRMIWKLTCDREKIQHRRFLKWGVVTRLWGCLVLSLSKHVLLFLSGVSNSISTRDQNLKHSLQRRRKAL